jgi:hypothetical protein
MPQESSSSLAWQTRNTTSTPASRCRAHEGRDARYFGTLLMAETLTA